jgi:hypothetical protein
MTPECISMGRANIILSSTLARGELRNLLTLPAALSASRPSPEVHLFVRRKLLKICDPEDLHFGTQSWLSANTHWKIVTGVDLSAFRRSGLGGCDPPSSQHVTARRMCLIYVGSFLLGLEMHHSMTSLSLKFLLKICCYSGGFAFIF